MREGWEDARQVAIASESRHPHVGHESRPFLGDFDFLPLAAYVKHGDVPPYPTSDDFQLAAMALGRSLDAADIWQLEAVRERRLHPGRLLEDAKADINKRVAKRLYDICVG
jgi:hypothetical protein